MEEKDIIGYKNFTDIVCTKTSKGWKVVNTLIQGVTTDLKDWDTREIIFSSENESMNKAYTDTVITMSYYLRKVGGNLFSEDASKVREKMIDGTSEQLEEVFGEIDLEKMTNDNNLLQ